MAWSKKTNKDMQETLYDTVGNPIAYLDIKDGNTIYLWNGIPVDYVESDGAIYGFNGTHIGWYDKGCIRDLNGYIVGFNRQKANVLLKRMPLKSLKQLKPLKSVRQLRRLRAFNRMSKSSMPLSQFLSKGVK